MITFPKLQCWHIVHHLVIQVQIQGDNPHIFLRCFQQGGGGNRDAYARQYNPTDLCDVFSAAINLLSAPPDNSQPSEGCRPGEWSATLLTCLPLILLMLMFVMRLAPDQAAQLVSIYVQMIWG